MSSLLGWISKKFSKVSNVAATTLLRKILRMVLDQETDDSVKLELFNDWSMNLKLKTVFVKPDTINSLTDIVSFQSIYLSELSFDGSYNLSKHFVKIDRCVVEMDMHPNRVHQPANEDLSASIQDFRSKMPIQEDKTFTDWLLHCVELVKVNISHFTAIVKVADDLPRITVELHDIDFIINHKDSSLFSCKIGLIKIFHGENLNKVRICESKDISFMMMLNQTISLNFPDSEAFVDLDTVNIISEVLTFVLNLIPQKNQTLINSAEQITTDQQIVIVNLKKARVSTSHFTFDAFRTEISVQENNVDIIIPEIDSPLIQMKQKTPLMINVKLPILDPITPPNACSISSFVQWEHEVLALNILRVKIMLPEFEANLPMSQYKDLLETCLWFSNIAPRINVELRNHNKDNEITPQNEEDLNKETHKHDKSKTIVAKPEEKAAVAVSLFISKAKLTVDNLTLNTEKTSIGVFLNVTEDIEVQVNVSATKIYVTCFDSMIVQSIPSNSALACVVRLGLNPSVDVNASNFIVGVPRKEGFEELLRFIDTVSQPPIFPPPRYTDQIRKETNIFPIKVIIKASDIFADYMTFAMPCRMIGHVISTKLDLIVNESKVDGKGTNTCFIVHLSNKRQKMPIRALISNNKKELERFGFVELFKAVVNNFSFSFVKPDKFSLEIGNVTCAGGFCSDSLDLLISLYAHLRFGLEYNDEPQIKSKQQKHVKTKEELENILSQSLHQSFLQQIPDMESNSPQSQTVEIKTESSDPDFQHEKSQETLSTSESSCEIQIENPKMKPNVSIKIKEANCSILFYGGSDFEKIFDLRRLTKVPEFTDEEVVEDDFDFIMSRDEFPSLEINTVLCFKLGLFTDDPSINIRIITECSVFDIIDKIPDSNARLMLGIEKRDAKITVLFDILNDDSLRLNIELPDIGIFITQQQIDFLINLFSRSIPVFQGDTVDVPTKFDFFGIRGSNVLINAHFTLFLSVSLEDVLIQLPICALSSVSSIDDLIGRLSEFYFDQLMWSAFSVAGGLPVINNIRRIGRAVGDLFTNLGWKSLSVLLRTIATEALNIGTCATSLTETLLGYAVNAAAGDEDWRRSPIASLIVTHNIGALPNVILVPGRKAVAGATRMLRYVKDKVNPNQRADRKRTKL